MYHTGVHVFNKFNLVLTHSNDAYPVRKLSRIAYDFQICIVLSECQPALCVAQTRSEGYVRRGKTDQCGVEGIKTPYLLQNQPMLFQYTLSHSPPQ